MNTVAWVLQIVLAVLFFLHGLLFTVAYAAAARRVEARGRPPSSLPPALRQFIGVAELAAAFGLTVPPAVHVFPWLAPLAAAGLVAAGCQQQTGSDKTGKSDQANPSVMGKAGQSSDQTAQDVPRLIAGLPATSP